VDAVDKSGMPRSRREIEEALQAVKGRIIRGPMEPFLIHLVVAKDVLEEALETRKRRGE
jgi:hypothetical protein